MPDEDPPEKVWDEYDWERFLQQQDQKTEKYMELLERYIDNPDRDQIIAREMGWNHLLNKEGQEWADHVDSQFSKEALGAEEAEEAESSDPSAFSFEVHPLYQAAFSLAASIDLMFEEFDLNEQSHPAVVSLSSQASLISAKLAAALSDDDIDEIGMTIAYLKRALKAVTAAMGHASQLLKEGLIDGEHYGPLNQQLFVVRDGIISLMGEFRAEWRRRFQR